MKEMLTKLAEIASRLDEAGHSEQADKIDQVLREFATLTATAAGMGSESLSDEEKALMGQKPAAPLPPSSTGLVVMKSKTPDAQGYGFHSAASIDAAVKGGKVDEAVAIAAMKEYLTMMGYGMIGETLQELLNSAISGKYLPLKGKDPEVYGGKSFWQRVFGK